jgi:hypothetical protein
MCNWSTFGARTNHGQTWIHKIHHDPYSILYAWPRGLHPNVILSRDTQVGSPEIPKIETFATLEAHNFLWRLSIEMKFKAKL